MNNIECIGALIAYGQNFELGSKTKLNFKYMVRVTNDTVTVTFANNRSSGVLHHADFLTVSCRTTLKKIDEKFVTETIKKCNDFYEGWQKTLQ